jgi:hypothetical protein
MIGLIVLLQVAVVATPEPDGSRKPVSAAPVDLSAAASRIHINRKALDGWVPLKGVPAPAPVFPAIVFVPSPLDARRGASRENLEENAFSDLGESVNSFDGARPYFYLGRGARRLYALGPRARLRQAAVAVAPDRSSRGNGRREGR